MDDMQTFLANSQPEESNADQRRRIERVLRKKSFAVLSSVSPAGRPHAAGVIYQYVDGELWVHTMRSSRKARNVVAEGHVGICVPARRLPVGPPFTVHFQGQAELVAMDAPEAVALLERGALGKISGHGALGEPDGVFMRIRPQRTVHSYGIGVSAIAVARDPLHAGARSSRWD